MFSVVVLMFFLMWFVFRIRELFGLGYEVFGTQSVEWLIGLLFVIL